MLSIYNFEIIQIKDTENIMTDWLSCYSPRNLEEIDDEIAAYIKAEQNDNVEQINLGKNKHIWRKLWYIFATYI